MVGRIRNKDILCFTPNPHIFFHNNQDNTQRIIHILRCYTTSSDWSDIPFAYDMFGFVNNSSGWENRYACFPGQSDVSICMAGHCPGCCFGWFLEIEGG